MAFGYRTILTFAASSDTYTCLCSGPLDSGGLSLDLASTCVELSFMYMPPGVGFFRASCRVIDTTTHWAPLGWQNCDMILAILALARFALVWYSHVVYPYYFSTFCLPFVWFVGLGRLCWASACPSYTIHTAHNYNILWPHWNRFHGCKFGFPYLLLRVAFFVKHTCSIQISFLHAWVMTSPFWGLFEFGQGFPVFLTISHNWLCSAYALHSLGTVAFGKRFRVRQLWFFAFVDSIIIVTLRSTVWSDLLTSPPKTIMFTFAGQTFVACFSVSRSN